MLASPINEQLFKVGRSASWFLRQAPALSHTDASNGHLHERSLTDKQVRRIRGK
jgi:hypothetical protein